MSSLYIDPLPKRFFRLLFLYPGDDEDKITGELKVFRRDSAPSYEALSYAWGSPEPTGTIALNGHQVSIGSNLFAALRGLRYINSSRPPENSAVKEIQDIDEIVSRYPICKRRDRYIHDKPSGERIVWVDALCVNQKDDEEKCRQVKMMGSIFSKAETVLIWLGVITGDELNALPILSAAWGDFHAKIRPDDVVPRMYRPVNAPSGYPSFGDEQWYSLVNFFDKDWFERMWVIQEVVLATKAVALLGGIEISWDIIGGAAFWLIRGCLPEAALLDQKIHTTTIVKVTRGLQRMRAAGTIQYTKTSRKIWNILQTGSDFKSTLPIDRVHSILDLFPELDMEPDYSVDAIQAFRNATRQLIEHAQDLVFLGLVNHGASLASNATSTWVLTWSDRLTLMNAPREFAERKHRASDNEPLHLLATPTHASLKLRAIVLPKVVTIGSVITNKYHRLLRGYLVEVFEEFLEFTRSTKGFCSYGDMFVDMSIQYFLKENINAWLDSADAYLDSDGPPFIPRVAPFNPPDGLPVRASEETYQYITDSCNDLLQAVAMYHSGRRLFLMENGYLGIGPQALEAGDQVALLLGGMTLFVLRELSREIEGSEENKQYQLVGECYVHGLMKGQLVKYWKRGELEAGDIVLV